MARSTSAEKRPGFFSQIRSLFTFTREAFPWLGWLLAGIVVLGVALGVVVGFLLQPQWWGILLWGITGLMVGALAAMMTMTRFSTRAMYRKLDGMPGASGHVLSNMLGRNWRGEEMPVGINPKTQEAVYRAVGRGGIVVVGEGSKGRLTRLMRDERMRAQRVASGVPVHEFYVGHGEGEVPIDQLAKTIKALPKAIDRATMGAVLQRIESVSQSITSLPIPKGIDPTKVRSQRPR
ncbi:MULTISPECIES: DUF4191 family protein [Microbacterium]|uniref:DUF4191 domain-containing protein n=1 Tax=Microbacterium barkeri TaxID=33917 RepID=A0A9W6LV54_9MICO|nr:MULTISPECIES: DUF4191 family protein [Microbacterium]MDI6942393.1 DUF4191 family protein [Microbacterium barkeri]MDR6876267.1 hypothetical protein [Microbacterium barkeri]WRH17241.1 DUF4191 family protein [Microbacterium sp. JZ37]GLJ60384.1 hypothetical protein GCM10017576_05130 [Microbacterium barkeri]